MSDKVGAICVDTSMETGVPGVAIAVIIILTEGHGVTRVATIISTRVLGVTSADIITKIKGHGAVLVGIITSIVNARVCDSRYKPYQTICHGEFESPH